MMRWENGLSSGWSLCDSDKKMEPPGTLNTLSAKGLSASAICLGASLEYSTSTLLIVCTPQKFIQTLAGGTISPRRGFYSWIPAYPPDQPDQCQEAVLLQDTYLFCPDHRYFSRPTILLSFWRNCEWIYACSSVTSASAATLKQMTAFFLLLSQSQWPHSPGEHRSVMQPFETSADQFTNYPKPAFFLWDSRNPITMHSWRKEKLPWIGH